MLIRKSFLDAIAAGRVTLAFRRWRRPTVRAGGTLKTAAGLLAIEAVDPIGEADIAPADAIAAGFSTLADLLKDLAAQREGQLYRIRLHLAGPDPRISLRSNDDLSRTDLETLSKKLASLDTRSIVGPWTEKALTAIHQSPGLKAVLLAEATGFEKEWLKTNVRKLKNLGLTESLSPGYRLSPRGLAYLKTLSDRPL